MIYWLSDQNKRRIRIMKNKVTSVAAALAVVFPLCAFAAEGEAADRVEIDFAVGDNVLMVNGEPLEVTAPYVVGEGTTLVPVRVITEAFGADVGWDGDTQTVTLDYPGVSITLRIGSAEAQVNDHTEQLAAAPELYEGVTMVPLRFISETFDASVNWDSETSRITVVKEPHEEQAQIQAGTDKAYVGDSYYGWSMKNPTIMEMEDRSFDGRETFFANESGGIAIAIAEMDEDDTADDVYNSTRALVGNMTISIADRSTDENGNTMIHFRAKNNETTYDLLAAIKSGELYTVMTICNNDAADMEDIMDIASSFSVSARDDMYDMSNIENGSRTFTDEYMGVSLKLPADYYSVELDSTNRFQFASRNNEASYVALSVYSKSDTVTAEKLAAADREYNLSVMNPSITSATEVVDTKAAGVPAKQYTLTVNGAGTRGKFVMKDTFFEIGDYVYNLGCQTSVESEADAIIASVSAEKLDAGSVGTILKDVSPVGDRDLELGSAELTLPEGWSVIEALSDSDSAILTNGNASVTAMELDGADTQNMQSFLNDISSHDSLWEQYGGDDTLVTIVPGSVKTAELGGRTFYTSEARFEYEDMTMYDTLYAAVIGDKGYLFNYSRLDVYYGGAYDEAAEAIVSSLK